MSASSSSPELTDAPGSGVARCRHFGRCGGCARQDLGYEAQLAEKARRVSGLLAPVEIDAVHPSPELWFYRNKMEFSFGDVYPPRPDGPALKLGLKPKGRWHEILDLAECFLLSPETPALLAAVRRWAEREGVPPYNSHKREGLLRHLVVREAKNGPDRLVELVAAPGELPKESFVAAVRSAYPATSVLWGSNAKASDTAIPDSGGALFGEGFITETLRFPGRELRFRISPRSFFQTNTRGAQVLYGVLRGWTATARPRRLLDLYCGGGGIGLSLSDLCEAVVGAELNPAAAEDARRNAALNGIANAQFYSGAVETLLAALLAMRPDLVVVDPPRAGLQRETLRTLLAARPERLVYVSCNPEALARDLKVLLERYRPERVEVVDLFPHTEHVETAVLLACRDR